jgi:hypothetical protein
MGRFNITRNNLQILIDGSPSEVFDLLQRNARWSWKTDWSHDLISGERAFYVKGALMKDNGAEALCEIVPAAEGGTVIQTIANRGGLMDSLGGNVFGVGVGKFQQKVMDAVEEILRNA